jgi:hypothetical protein
MENVHAERSAGWSVLCYVAVLVIATFFNSGMPGIDVKPSDAALAFDQHRFTLLCGAWLTFPAVAFLLWFLVGLRGYLTAAPGRPEGLPTFALIAGVVMAASSLWAACLQIAAVYFPPDTFTANGLAGIFDAFVFVQGGLGYAPVAIFLFAAAHSMRRHESAPKWFGATLATLSIFFSYGDMAPGGPGPGIVGALPAAAWLIATGIVLIQNKRGSAGTSTSAAS